MVENYAIYIVYQLVEEQTLKWMVRTLANLGLVLRFSEYPCLSNKKIWKRSGELVGEAHQEETDGIHRQGWMKYEEVMRMNINYFEGMPSDKLPNWPMTNIKKHCIVICLPSSISEAMRRISNLLESDKVSDDSLHLTNSLAIRLVLSIRYWVGDYDDMERDFVSNQAKLAITSTHSPDSI